MPPLDRYIDLHCERLQDGLFEEPLNTLTNLCFFVASYILHRNTAHFPKRPALISFFIIIICFIGIGSGVFHATARMWGALMDSIPIAMFALVYVFAFGKHVLRMGWLGGFALILLYVFTYHGIKYLYLGVPAGRMPDGWVSMIPSVYFLALLTIWLFALRSKSAVAYLKITIVAAIAVYFRTIDRSICADFHLGTHFLWHALAATMVYLMVKEIIRNYHTKRISA